MNPTTECLAVDKVIILIKGKVVYRKNIHPEELQEIWHKNLQAL
jgi:hypothetical protein